MLNLTSSCWISPGFAGGGVTVRFGFSAQFGRPKSQTRQEIRRQTTLQAPIFYIDSEFEVKLGVNHRNHEPATQTKVRSGPVRPEIPIHH